LMTYDNKMCTEYVGHGGSRIGIEWVCCPKSSIQKNGTQKNLKGTIRSTRACGGTLYPGWCPMAALVFGAIDVYLLMLAQRPDAAWPQPTFASRLCKARRGQEERLAWTTARRSRDLFRDQYRSLVRFRYRARLHHRRHALSFRVSTSSSEIGLAVGRKGPSWKIS
jgi:hypothetical protein